LRDVGDLNVIGGVHIQAEHDYRDHVRETRWLQRVADNPASRGIPPGRALMPTLTLDRQRES
jgi:predicted TIM-barrel fold metal-dependent hydrolase